VVYPAIKSMSMPQVVPTIVAATTYHRILDTTSIWECLRIQTPIKKTERKKTVLKIKNFSLIKERSANVHFSLNLVWLQCSTEYLQVIQMSIQKGTIPKRFAYITTCSVFFSICSISFL